MHVPVARRGRRRAPRAADRRSARPDRATPARGTDLWYVVPSCRTGSRIDSQLEIRRGEHVERTNDPLNPKVSHSPFGALSVCFATATVAGLDLPRPGRAARGADRAGACAAARCAATPVTVYLPARFRRAATYPLLVVHDGSDYLKYAAAKTVLDNLIHRLDVAEIVVAFVHPHDRLAEYANSAAHARYVTARAACRTWSPSCRWSPGRPADACSGSSFGAVAAL